MEEELLLKSFHYTIFAVLFTSSAFPLVDKYVEFECVCTSSFVPEQLEYVGFDLFYFVMYKRMRKSCISEEFS